MPDGIAFPGGVATIADRSMRIPAGKIVRTGYVPVEDVTLACRERMAIGDVETAYRRRLQLGADQPWPPAIGDWDGARFRLIDGRHDYVAALMLGVEHVFVAWIADAETS